MFATCLTCNRHLGRNEEIGAFPVGLRLAWDAGRGRLWVVCTACGGWNLSPLEERWEAIEQCERAFRGTHLRVSTDTIGLARLPSGLELIRVGRAPRAEVAAWRYGRKLLPPGLRGEKVRGHAISGADRVLGSAFSAAARLLPSLRRRGDPATWLRIRADPGRVVHAVELPSGGRALIRLRHLERAELVRPERTEPWHLSVPHEAGLLRLASEQGLRTAGKLLAALNGSWITAEQVRGAIRRLDEAGDPDGYFARVAALALRTSWGRLPDAPRGEPILPPGASDMERLALMLTNRAFWARGAIGSDPRMSLPRLPVVDRLALEMAAHEDSERAALEGELAELARAWREAEEIAQIADALFDERSRPARAAGSPGHGWGIVRGAALARTLSM